MAHCPTEHTLPKPFTQRQVCSLPRGSFCVTHHRDVVINQFIPTDLLVGEMVVMSLPCLTVTVTLSWGLTCFAPPLTPNLLAVGGQCSSLKLRAWCLCLLDFWHCPAWCPGCLEKEVLTSVAEKTSSSTNVGSHGESIWEQGALQGGRGKEEQRLWLKSGHWLCPLWCCRDWTKD